MVYLGELLPYWVPPRDFTRPRESVTLSFDDWLDNVNSQLKPFKTGHFAVPYLDYYEYGMTAEWVADAAIKSTRSGN